MDQTLKNPDSSGHDSRPDRLCLLEIPGDGTAVITLNRARKRNALSAALITELNAAFRTLDRDSSVRVIVLTGPTGGPFSGSYDICGMRFLLRSLICGVPSSGR